MEIRVSPLQIHLARPFRISHGVSTTRTNVVVQVGEGLGEAGLPPYLETDFEQARSWLDGITLPRWDSHEPPPVSNWLSRIPQGPLPAICSLDLALHDLWGQRLGQPLYRLFGLSPSESPRTFKTISLPEDGAELEASDIPDWPLLKIKVGTGKPERDIDLVRRVRELAGAAELCVDANGAWSIPEAVRALPRLKEVGVLFVEQPIAARDPDDWHLLRRLVVGSDRPPLVADESVRTTEDVIALAGAADGINIKLAKCGGLSASRRLIDLGRALDMSITLGCMVESSLAITAASHLASLADHVDLDGADLLANDPFEGLHFDDGRPIPSSRSGIGARPRTQT